MVTPVSAAAALVAEEAALPAAPVALVNALLTLDSMLLPRAPALLAAPAAPDVMVEKTPAPPEVIVVSTPPAPDVTIVATDVATDSASLITLAAPEVAALKTDAAPEVAWLMIESTCRSLISGLPKWKLNAEAMPKRAVMAMVERILMLLRDGMDEGEGRFGRARKKCGSSEEEMEEMALIYEGGLGTKQ